MGTPQGGSPDDGPDAARERPEPDPSVTSFASPPQDPPWPAPHPTTGPPPADSAPSDSAPAADAAPADPPPPAASWPPPAGPGDATKVGGWGSGPESPWAKPEPVPGAAETRMGWTPPAVPASWPPPGPGAAPPWNAPTPGSDQPPWNGQPGWNGQEAYGQAPWGGQPTGNGQVAWGGQATGSGQAPWGAPAAGGPPTAAQPSWAPGPDPSQPGWGPGPPTQQGWAPGGPPTQVGGPWTGTQPGWPPPTGTQPGWPQPGPRNAGHPYAGPQNAGPQYPGPQYPGPQYAGQYPGAPYAQYASGQYPGGRYPGPGGPPRRRERLVALVVVGVLLLAALGVGGYLLLHRATGTVVPADFRPITTATLSYSVPPDWVDSANSGSVLGAPLEGRADAPGYECDGNRYYRGVIASAFVPGERPAAAVAAAFARETGSSFYVSAAGAPPQVQVSDARPFEVDGVPGQLVEATSRTPTDDGCLATEGTVLILAVPTTGPDGAPGTAVLVVNGDAAGGPSTAPPSPDRSTLEAVLASARLPSV